MTDSRLQQLKRAWETSGAVEDEAAYLRERVRVGELSRHCLELTAYCGNEAARRIAGSDAKLPRELSTWIVGLERFGSEVLHSACAAIANKALGFWVEAPPQQVEINAMGPVHVVSALKEFVANPGQGTQLLREAQEVMDQGTESADEDAAPIAWEAWDCIWWAADVITDQGDPKKAAAAMCSAAVRLPLADPEWLEAAKSEVLNTLATDRTA